MGASTLITRRSVVMTAGLALASGAGTGGNAANGNGQGEPPALPDGSGNRERVGPQARIAPERV